MWYPLLVDTAYDAPIERNDLWWIALNEKAETAAIQEIETEEENINKKIFN